MQVMYLVVDFESETLTKNKSLKLLLKFMTNAGKMSRNKLFIFD